MRESGRAPARTRDTAPPSGLLRTWGVHDWVTSWWQGRAGAPGKVASLLALPFEMAFRTGVGLRNRLYDGGLLPLQRAPVPVLSLGNLTVGGTGKTPLAAWLAGRLLERGRRPALVARGYGEDELRLHRKWNSGVPVVAQEDRAFGVWRAAKNGADVAVLDDAFQHRRLARDLDIVVVASTTPRTCRLLPRGPFRESFRALERAGIVIVTEKGPAARNPELEAHLARFLSTPPARARLEPDGWEDLSGQAASPPPDDILAVSGIGDPESFVRVLEQAGRPPGDLFTYPDHHPYTSRDVRNILSRARGRCVVTTEKDAMRLKPFRGHFPDLRVLTLRVEIVEGEDRLWSHVEGALASGGAEPAGRGPGSRPEGGFPGDVSRIRNGERGRSR